MIVFSTCWNSSRHSNGDEMIEEILALGFDSVELSHGLKLSLLPGVLKLVNEGRVRVAGVHNFFPAPIDVSVDAPDCVEFTSFRKEERDRALKLSLKSIEEAARIGATYVVLHLGSVVTLNRRKGTSILEKMAVSGRLPSDEYRDFKNDFVKKRRAYGALYLDRARLALHELATKAAELGIKLGIEARSHYEQVPDEEEMQVLMQEFAENDFVGYWHDFGHIQRKHNLLLLNHEQVLSNMSPSIIGAHVNDVRWPMADHRSPFYGGDVDFACLMPLLPKDIPLVWELSGSRDAEEIKSSLALWKEKFPQHV